jgi:flagellar biosynthetic protein FlhB
MSEDKTQSPSKLRRQKARDEGQVAQSPELTGAAALLAAAFLLGGWGESLVTALLVLVREPLTGSPGFAADAAEVIARLRHSVLTVAWPLGVVTIGPALAALAMHQAQVLGLWAPGLLAPNVGRLWTSGQGPGLSTRGGRSIWGVVKVLVVGAVAAWIVQSSWPAFQSLSGSEPQVIARASGQALRQTALALSAATLALGVVDYALQYRRFEELLRMTPEEQREDQRSMEGDPTLRARRRRIAKSWRGASAEDLVGATLVLTGSSGLTVVLAGGPPPARISVRSLAQGISGDRLRSAATGVVLVEAPALALHLARRRAPSLPLDAAETAALAAIWPTA